LQSDEVRMPLRGGLGGSRRSRSGSPSSLASRFRLVEELIEAGESGRDNAATPLTWGARTAGEAMFGGVCNRAVEVETPGGGRWEVGWIGAAGSVARFASRRVREREDAAAGCTGCNTKKLSLSAGRQAGRAKIIQMRCTRWRDNPRVGLRPNLVWHTASDGHFLNAARPYECRRKSERRRFQSWLQKASTRLVCTSDACGK
jgi:hypothetical protein